MELDELLQKAFESEKMPDFDGIELKEGTTLEDCRKAIAGLAKRCWESDKLMDDLLAMLTGAVLMETDLDTGGTKVVTMDELVKRCEKHLGIS